MKKLTKHLFTIPFFFSAIYALVIFSLDLDFNLIDSMGRLASAVAQYRFGFHEYNDGFFFGTIQGLFYPPLQDFIMSIFLPLFTAPSAAYKLYLLLIIAVYLLSAFRFANFLSSWWSRLFFAIFFVGFWYMDKYSPGFGFVRRLNFYELPSAFFFQGLSFIDTLGVGLSNQTLSGVFLWIYLKQTFDERPSKNRWFWMTCCILSHLVTGFIVVCLELFLFVFIEAWPQKKDRLFQILKSLIGSCFFWLPFLIYREEMNSSTIIGDKYALFVLATWAITAILYSKSKPWFVLLFGSLVGTIPLVAHKFTYSWGIKIPDFHYHRFLCYHVLIVVAALSFLLSSATIGTRKKVASAFIFTAAWLLQFAGFLYAPAGSLVRLRQELNYEGLSEKIQNGDDLGRTMVLEPFRAIDFGVESSLFMDNKRPLMTKGLYWESDHGIRLSSYFLRELLGPPSVLHPVSDASARPPTMTCEEITCRWRYLLEATGTQEFYTTRQLDSAQTINDVLVLLRQNFVNCVNKSEEFIKTNSSFKHGSVEFQGFQLKNQPPSWRMISADEIKPAKKKDFEYEAWYEASRLCSQKNALPSVSMLESDAKQVKSEIRSGQLSSTSSSDSIHVQRISSGQYKILAQDENLNTFIWLPLNPVPGLEAFDKKGQKQIIYRAFPGSVLKIDGATEIKYRKPLAFYISYFLAGLFWLAICFQWIWNRIGKLKT